MTSHYFYLLPNIHKPLNSWPDPHMPARRPIVSDCESESSKIWHVSLYIKNLGSNNRPQWLLISADVELLYTCMKIDHIFDFIKKIFAEFPDLKGRWKLDSLRNVGRTDGHKDDFVLCPMLCIALSNAMHSIGQTITVSVISKCSRNKATKKRWLSLQKNTHSL